MSRTHLLSPSTGLGLWLIGAAGNVGVTVAVGLAAVRRGLADASGLVTEESPCNRLGLVSLSRMVLGGHEVRRRRLVDAARDLDDEAGIFGRELLKRVAADLRTWQRNVRPGVDARRGSARSTIDRLRRDLRGFKRRCRLGTVVVVNVASTEPVFRAGTTHRSWARLQAALGGKGSSILPPSSLYAVAAIEEGCPYINFTPSAGCDVPAIGELAELRGVPVMGSDGKTGETLLKSVLAPMFAARGLRVESWAGHNILGNRDGEVLSRGPNRAAKLRGKNDIVANILGYAPASRTSIEYVPPLGDWKTAWDHVQFRGFLGVKMQMQFIWQGCDSILAAPLVIDLSRLAEFHRRVAGGGGPMPHLACFFKRPMGTTEHRFTEQVRMLHEYVERHAPRRRHR